MMLNRSLPICWLNFVVKKAGTRDQLWNAQESWDLRITSSSLLSGPSFFSCLVTNLASFFFCSFFKDILGIMRGEMTIEDLIVRSAVRNDIEKWKLWECLGKKREQKNVSIWLRSFIIYPFRITKAWSRKNDQLRSFQSMMNYVLIWKVFIWENSKHWSFEDQLRHHSEKMRRAENWASCCWINYSV